MYLQDTEKHVQDGGWGSVFQLFIFLFEKAEKEKRTLTAFANMLYLQSDN